MSIQCEEEVKRMEAFNVSNQKHLKSELVKKVEEWSDQNVFACYQCGKCSSACPLGLEMDHLPHQIMKLLQMGDEPSLLTTNTPWICASCLQCSAKCPKGVHITEIMEALREYHLRKREDKWDITHDAEDLKKVPQIAIIANFRKMTG